MKSKIHPIGAQAVPVEFVLDQLVSDKPSHILCIYLTHEGSVRFIHSTMDTALRAYLVKIADSVLTSQIAASTVMNDPTRKEH